MDEREKGDDRFGASSIDGRAAMTPGAARTDGSALWTGDTLTGLLAARTAERPEAPAILAESGTITYGGLSARVAALAGSFARLGLGRGDGIALQLPNGPEFLTAYLAAARLGAVVSTVHMPYGPREAADVLRHAEARVAVAPAQAGDRRPAAALAEAAARLPRLGHVVAVGPGAPPGTLAFDDLLAAGAPADLPPPPAAEDPFVTLFTSGTSSSPKAVRTDYRRFLANARVNHVEKRMGPDSVMLSCAPYTHLLGLYAFHLTLYAGSASAMLPAFAPAAFMDACAAYRPSHVFVAPAHVAACRAAGLLRPGALAPVEFLVISGALAAPGLFHDAQTALTRGQVGQLWGMTECQCGMFTRPDEPVEAAATGAGRPSPGNEARVTGPDGAPLAAGAEGALEIRGASVFDGYWRNAEANAEAFTADGWFRTGDLAVVAADGAVTITGREKDLINRGGIKINPADVEEAIDRHPDVVQSAIVPMADETLGERACCFAVARPGAAPTLEDLTAWLSGEGIARIRWPERLVLIDALPLTPTRKVVKGRLKLPEEA